MGREISLAFPNGEHWNSEEFSVQIPILSAGNHIRRGSALRQKRTSAGAVVSLEIEWIEGPLLFETVSEWTTGRSKSSSRAAKWGLLPCYTLLIQSAWFNSEFLACNIPPQQQLSIQEGFLRRRPQPANESNGGNGIQGIGCGIIDRVREHQRSDAKTKAAHQGQLPPGERTALTRPIPGLQFRCHRIILLRRNRRREGALAGNGGRFSGRSGVPEGGGRTWHRASLPPGGFPKAYRSIGSAGPKADRVCCE